jgi:hypothetical protein
MATAERPQKKILSNSQQGKQTAGIDTDGTTKQNNQPTQVRHPRGVRRSQNPQGD